MSLKNMQSAKALVLAAARRWNRRDLFRAGSLAAFAGFSGTAVAARKRVYEDSIYTRMLGVRPIVPCRGHTTAFGGSLMPAEVLRAIAEANDCFVDMYELHQAAGRRVAEVMRAEAGLVTAGSFSAMLLGCAACLTGKDPAKIDALPHPSWPRREVIIQKAHRVVYDRAYRAAGATIVEVETKEDFANAISERTVMLAALASTEQNPKNGVLTIREYIDLGKRAGIPVLVDAASELPPFSKLTQYTSMGADLTVISGGKGILGPQSTGLLAGRADLIEAAMMHNSPNPNIGRGMKVGKEEIIGLLVALDRYVNLDHDQVMETWNRKARYLADQLEGIRGFRAVYRINQQGFAEVRIDWDTKIIPITGKQAARALLQGEPRIMYYDDDTGGVLQTRSMKDGDEILAARRLRQFFSEEASKRA
jgi:L-seryl-tRNA(Ser) seleniumtransferase